jgi:hypothetical protein
MTSRQLRNIQFCHYVIANVSGYEVYFISELQVWYISSSFPSIEGDDAGVKHWLIVILITLWVHKLLGYVDAQWILVIDIKVCMLLVPVFVPAIHYMFSSCGKELEVHYLYPPANLSFQLITLDTFYFYQLLQCMLEVESLGRSFGSMVDGHNIPSSAHGSWWSHFGMPRAVSFVTSRSVGQQ